MAHTIKTQNTTVAPAAGETMAMFVASPAGLPARAIIVLQEAFGVNAHIKDICQRFAAQGYLAVAPELYHRSGQGLTFGYNEFPRLRPTFQQLTNAGLVTDIKAAISYATHAAGLTTSQVATIGFCMGGFASFLAATQLQMGAAVVFYGAGIVRERPGMKIQPLLSKEPAPGLTRLLCHFGGKDASIPPEDITAIRNYLRRSAPPEHEVHLYPDADHGFFCNERGAYHQAAADLAWQRTLEFLVHAL